MITPAVISAQDSDQDVSRVYLLAAGQSLALGPLLGLSPSLVLRKVTRRWAWWIGANLASWLIVDAVIYLLGRLSGDLDVLTGDGSLVEVYLTLIATTPLTGPALLWVLAPRPWMFRKYRSRHDSNSPSGVGLCAPSCGQPRATGFRLSDRGGRTCRLRRGPSTRCVLIAFGRHRGSHRSTGGTRG
ncbi:hypothetical protein [Streptomyces sp. NPDC050564]|uniref:hypothetical protein n=1 Tax=Streptomyces sp. NPDC050564 TaxID=3365631 RepID=UPI003789A237